MPSKMPLTAAAVRDGHAAQKFQAGQILSLSICHCMTISFIARSAVVVVVGFLLN